MIAAPILRNRPGSPFGAAFEQQARHAKQRFTQEISGDAARHLIVDGRPRGLARVFPQQAAGKGIGRGLPEIQSRGAREPLIKGALIGMQELIGGEGIVVHDPFVVQIVPEVGERRCIDFRINRVRDRSGSAATRTPGFRMPAPNNSCRRPRPNPSRAKVRATRRRSAPLSATVC